MRWGSYFVRFEMADGNRDAQRGTAAVRKAWTAPRIIEAGLSVARHTEKINSFATAEYHLSPTTPIS
jgi:hypothetical protein